MAKKTFSIITLLCLTLLAYAQAPAGYYSAATGRSGKNLKTALHEIINSHTARSYDQLWTDFRKTDCRADGKVWDMYSSVTNYTFGNDQGGNYHTEGDVYNREHSFPKSWFNDAKPMYHRPLPSRAYRRLRERPPLQLSLRRDRFAQMDLTRRLEQARPLVGTGLQRHGVRAQRRVQGRLRAHILLHGHLL